MPLLPPINVGSLDEAEKVDSLVQQLNDWGRKISSESHAADYGEGSLTLKNDQLLLTRPNGEEVIIAGYQSGAIDENGNFKSIQGSSIEAETITSENIAAGTITADDIAAGTIIADNIAAGTITGDQIASNTITGNNITGGTINGTHIDTLDITGKEAKFDTGTIGGWSMGATELAGPAGAIIRSGQTDFNVGTGFWLGNVANLPKFSIGSSSGNQMSWDGTNLRVTGNFTPASVYKVYSYTEANLPQPPTTAGFNNPSGTE